MSVEAIEQFLLAVDSLLSKHYSGMHDQRLHGRRGSSGDVGAAGSSEGASSSSARDPLPDEIAITSVVKSYLKGESNWDGKVIVEDIKGAHGKFNFDSGRLYLKKRENPTAEEALLEKTTFLHEYLHSFGRKTGDDFLRGMGWEEGIVEQASRLLRKPALTKAGIDMNDPKVKSTFAARDKAHPYNRYINALEEIRNELGDNQGSFYIDLVKKHPRERIATIEQRLSERMSSAQVKQLLNRLKPVLGTLNYD